MRALNDFLSNKIKRGYKDQGTILHKYNKVYETVEQYVYYYNNEREILKLNEKSPVEYLIQQNFS